MAPIEHYISQRVLHSDYVRAFLFITRNNIIKSGRRKSEQWRNGMDGGRHIEQNERTERKKQKLAESGVWNERRAQSIRKKKEKNRCHSDVAIIINKAQQWRWTRRYPSVIIISCATHTPPQCNEITGKLEVLVYALWIRYESIKFKPEVKRTLCAEKKSTNVFGRLFVYMCECVREWCAVANYRRKVRMSTKHKHWEIGWPLMLSGRCLLAVDQLRERRESLKSECVETNKTQAAALRHIHQAFNMNRNACR